MTGEEKFKVKIIQDAEKYVEMPIFLLFNWRPYYMM